MKHSGSNAAPPPQPAGNLCVECGLCCDGTLFSDVELQLADDVDELRGHGLKVLSRGKPRFHQPCSALCTDRRCQVYDQRPQQCRAFECALLQAVQRGDLGIDAARRVIVQSRTRAETVRQLLRELGERSENRALAPRFRRLKQRFDQGLEEQAGSHEERLDRFAELTLAVHELQFLLRRKFYPDRADG